MQPIVDPRGVGLFGDPVAVAERQELLVGVVDRFDGVGQGDLATADRAKVVALRLRYREGDSTRRQQFHALDAQAQGMHGVLGVVVVGGDQLRPPVASSHASRNSTGIRPVAATARPLSNAQARIAALTRFGVDAARDHRSPAHRDASASTAASHSRTPASHSRTPASHSRTAAGVTDASDCAPSRMVRGRTPPTTGTSASIHRSSSHEYSSRVLGARSPRVAIHPRNQSPSGCSPSRGSRHTPRAIRDTSCASSWSASALLGNLPSVRSARSGPVYLACYLPEGSRRTAPEARRWRRHAVAVVIVGPLRYGTLWHEPTSRRVPGRSDRACVTL